jgi:hypothetical protein
VDFSALEAVLVVKISPAAAPDAVAAPGPNQDRE